MMTKQEFLILLGRRIVQLREAKGWSQAELARNCEKDRQSIERIENGKSNPTIFYLLEVAEGLDISLKELLNFKIPSNSK